MATKEPSLKNAGGASAKKFDVLGIAGILPLDFCFLLNSDESRTKAVQQLSELPLPLSDIGAVRFGYNHFCRAGGGKVANILAFLGRAGHRAGVCGAVGDDAAGKAVLDDLASYNVDCSNVRVLAGRCIVHQDGANSSEQVHLKPGPQAKWSPAQLPDISACGVLLLGRANQTVSGLVASSREHPKTRISFHLCSTPWRERELRVLHDLLGHCHLVVAAKAAWDGSKRAFAKLGLSIPTSRDLVVVYGGPNDAIAQTAAGVEVTLKKGAAPDI
jgi:sugar/nucleoside kinase (ribokinase family)